MESEDNQVLTDNGDGGGALELEIGAGITGNTEYYAGDNDEDWLSQWWDHSTCLMSETETKPTRCRPSSSQGRMSFGPNSRKADSRAYCPDHIRRRIPVLQEEHMAIVDSGASWRIVGIHWLSRWSTFGESKGWQQRITANRRRFLFGDNRLNDPLVSALLNASVTDKEDVSHSCVLEVDIASADVPMLIPRHSLTKMSALIDFREPSLAILSKTVAPLILSTSGHIHLQMFKKTPIILNNSATDNIFVSAVVGNGEDLFEDDSTNAPNINGGFYRSPKY